MVNGEMLRNGDGITPTIATRAPSAECSRSGSTLRFTFVIETPEGGTETKTVETCAGVPQ